MNIILLNSSVLFEIKKLKLQLFFLREKAATGVIKNF